MATSRYPLAREDKVPFYAILRRANTGNRDRGSIAAPPLPHHRTYGSVYGGSLDYPQQENEMDTNIDKSPKGGTSPGSPGASRAPGDIRSPGLSPDKPALTGSLQDKVGSAVDQARAGIADSASSASADLASDVEKMRADMASMKDTLA